MSASSSSFPQPGLGQQLGGGAWGLLPKHGVLEGAGPSEPFPYTRKGILLKDPLEAPQAWVERAWEMGHMQRQGGLWGGQQPRVSPATELPQGSREDLRFRGPVMPLS